MKQEWEKAQKEVKEEERKHYEEVCPVSIVTFVIVLVILSENTEHKYI